MSATLHYRPSAALVAVRCLIPEHWIVDGLTLAVVSTTRRHISCRCCLSYTDQLARPVSFFAKKSYNRSLMEYPNFCCTEFSNWM